ncbi:DUF642 domain-containing protein [Rheinheimera baltica]|uniref:DUF642 domain-containing protein n=1 Tax=Rheinheimera baltica TaxID=67576 RepID=A0ABT9I4B8_9GAMM|nr:DUF642 domain-containing protein [Rheinheimera baltica]MDP5138231.1 DUF642 domain-containing protein [Rheinheimera baltica]
MLFSFARNALCSAALLMASFSGHASLIVNGDFESNSVRAGSWNWFASSQVAGWNGSNIEVWNAMNGVLAQSGNHFIELNAAGTNNGLWSIFQMFATEIGQQYQLSFYYRARTYNNERFAVSVAGLNESFNNDSVRGWSFFTSNFIATDSTSILRFTALNSGTLGNFIDNVQVVGVPTIASVPAPASVALFGAGLFGLMASRRLRQRK